jgi:hypothetical protein
MPGSVASGTHCISQCKANKPAVLFGCFQLNPFYVNQDSK